MRTKKNIIISLTFLFWLALPGAAYAQDVPAAPAPAAVTPAPAATKNAAEEINVQLKVPLPFVPTRCTTTVIDPNDSTKTITVPAVCNLKDYLEGVYRLLIGAGALFAVVMIIIAGYQYLTSGGSSDKTGAAKKRIWNACIGLVLALMSYIILNAISARLVDLRLPLVAPVQRIEFNKEASCQTNKTLNNTSYVFRAKNASGGAGTVSPVTARAETLCGSNYEVYGSSDLNSSLVGECPGDKCTDPPNSSCILGQCRTAFLYGTIDWSPDNGFVDYVTVYPVCNNRLMDAVGSEDVAEEARLYKIPTETDIYSGEYGKEPTYKIAARICAALGQELKGFVLKVEVNNDCYGAWQIALDKDYAIGRSCNSPLTSVSSSGKTEYRFSSIDWAQVSANDLIPLAEIQSRAYNCNLVINRNLFPVVRKLNFEAPSRCPSYELF